MIGSLLKHLVRGARLLDAQGDLVGDADAVAFEGDDFFWMIGEHANVLEAQIDEDLGADAAFVLDHALASGFAVKLAALVEMDCGQGTRSFWCFDAEAAAGVMEVEQHLA